MRKIILILFSILFFTLGIIVAVFFNKSFTFNDEPNFELELVNKQVKIENNLNKNELQTTNLESDLKEKDEQKSKPAINKMVSNNVNFTSKIEKNNILEKDVKSNKNVESIEVPKSNDAEIKKEIWDLLGMTKEDYYNKPMHDWETIDFKTMEECLTYGDVYEPYLKGKELYNCREVLSMSGDFLGIMFDTENLEL